MSKIKEAMMGGKGAGILADVKNHREAKLLEAEQDREYDKRTNTTSK